MEKKKWAIDVLSTFAARYCSDRNTSAHLLAAVALKEVWELLPAETRRHIKKEAGEHWADKDASNRVLGLPD